MDTDMQKKLQKMGPLITRSDVDQLLNDVNENGLDLSGKNLRGIDLSNFDLDGANLRGADLSEATLSGADLSGAHLDNAVLFKANLNGAKMSRINLNQANLSKAQLVDAQLYSASLKGADLTDADLTHAKSGMSIDLTEANLTRANLTEVDFYGARFIKAKLIDSNLTGANLNGSQMNEADLTGAVLNGASLENVDLRRAILSDGALDNVKVNNTKIRGISYSKHNQNETTTGAAPNPRVVMPPILGTFDTSNLSKREVIETFQVEKIANANPANIQEVAATQIPIGNRYYESVLQQSQRSFMAALILSIFGTLLIFAAVIFLLFRQPSALAFVSLIGGVVLDVIAGLNFYLYGRASALLITLQTPLDRVGRFLLANSVCENIEGDLKNSTRAKLVEIIANVPITTNDKKNAEDKPSSHIIRKRSNNNRSI